MVDIIDRICQVRAPIRSRVHEIRPGVPQVLDCVFERWRDRHCRRRCGGPELGGWLALGVVFDVVLLGEPFCVVFDAVFGGGGKPGTD